MSADIEGLLAHLESSASLLESPPPALQLATVELSTSFLPQKDFLDRYQILEPIGQGGMGEVFLAEQLNPVSRKVAIKLIKAGASCKTMVARFEAERQALALMDHPNIASLYDGGSSETGHLYFVMEWVRGQTLAEFCTSKNLTTRQKLELFGQLCLGIQHAHQKGILHRDLKPSNVLVTLVQDRPVVKIIDFGIAKALGPRLTSASLHTQAGQLLGTLDYMAPEQAGSNHADIDTRADVYSLGAILYELIVGAPPFEKERLTDKPIDEAVRVLREEEPTRPRRRLQMLQETLDESDKAGRSTVLAGRIQKDLEWIVLKAIDKERHRRYDTPIELRQDIERYLQSLPVAAGPPSKVYRLRKTLHRHRIAFTLASFIVLSLSIASGIAIWQARIAMQANRKLNRTNDQLSYANQQLLDRMNVTRRGVATRSAGWGPRKAFESIVYDFDGDGTDDICVMGGQGWQVETDQGSSRVLNDIWMSSDGTNWTRHTSDAPWQERAAHHAAVHDGRLWIVGGAASDGQTLHDVWSYHPDSGWRIEVEHAPWLSRSNGCLVTANGRMWLIGGWHGAAVGNRLDDVWSSDNGRDWVQSIPVTDSDWQPRSRFAAVVRDNRIYIAGGWGRDGQRLADVWVGEFASPDSPTTVAWHRLTESAPFGPISGHEMVVATDRLWLMGGQVYSPNENKAELSNALWSSQDGVSWEWSKTFDTGSWPARDKFAAVVYHSQTSTPRIWIMGGNVAFPQNMSNSVWFEMTGNERLPVAYRDSPRTPIDIPTSSIRNVSSPLRRTQLVENELLILDMDVEIDIEHPDVSELSISLLHEQSGRMVRLFHRSQKVVGGMQHTIYSDEADQKLENAIRLDHGRVQPVEPLITFRHQLAEGNWTLLVEDQVEGNEGTLIGWTLEFYGIESETD